MEKSIAKELNLQNCTSILAKIKRTQTVISPAICITWCAALYYCVAQLLC